MVDSKLPDAGRRLAGERAEPAAGQARALRKWRCLNCGQLIFTAGQDTPPDRCQVCNDMTTWQAPDA